MLTWLSFLIIILPFSFALNPTDGVDLQIVRVLIPLLFLVWLVCALIKKSLFFPLTAQTFFLLLFLLIATLSLFTSESSSWGVRKMLFLFSIMPLYFIVSDLVHKKGDALLRVVQAIAIGGGLAAAVGLVQVILQFIIGLDGTLALWQMIAEFFLGDNLGGTVSAYNSWLVHVGGHDVFRAIGVFPDPHMFAFFLGLTLPFAFYIYKKTEKGLFLFLFLLIVVVDALTFTRGAYVGMLCGGLVWLVFTLNETSSTKKRVVSLAALTLFAVLLIPNPITERFTSSFSATDGSISERKENLRQAVDIITENPLTGVGLGNYSRTILPSADYRTPIYAHNLYLDIAAEIGILGLVAWLGFIGFVFLSFIRSARYGSSLALFGAVSIVIFSVHALFDTPLFSVHVLPLLMVAAALSVARS